MLIAFAVAALWLSTAAGYIGSYDVRIAITLLILVAAGLKYYCSEGRWKCFWLGFSAVLAATAYYQGNMAPTFEWLEFAVEQVRSSAATPASSDDLFGPPVQTPAPGSELRAFVSATFRLVFNLLLAGVAGFIGVTVFDQSERIKKS